MLCYKFCCVCIAATDDGESDPKPSDNAKKPVKYPNKANPITRRETVFEKKERIRKLVQDIIKKCVHYFTCQINIYTNNHFY